MCLIYEYVTKFVWMQMTEASKCPKLADLAVIAAVLQVTNRNVYLDVKD